MTIADFTPLRFATNDTPERDRVAMWREVFGRSVFRLDIEPLPDTPFHADLKLGGLPGLRVVSGDIGGTRDARTRALLDDGNDELGLNINVAGTNIVSQCQREIIAGPGDAVLMSCAEIGSFIRPDAGKVLGLRVPRAALATLIPNVDDALIRPIPRDAQALGLLMDYVGVLGDIETLASVELQRAVVVHVYDLIALTIGPTRDVAVVAQGRGGRAAKLRAIKTDIVANLAHRDLGVGFLAARHRFSPRYIQRLFEADGTSLTEFVLGQRLDWAHRTLIDRRFPDHAISAIAFEAGFGDLSYFNRAFRRRYGATPSDVREMAQQKRGS
ncbi:MAG: AraC family transcriptional regulator [Xanthobacteraceae bacterium]|nr:AraC family transcriptional regulator [Xanthobacteraceae bacterium]